ncbi:NUDIX hydrolase domain-like protein [Suillus fuscotomentosus]|uniref:NUDIX hydrolase domain-like protein n=1 Tax=Suillus fuscotomentosus TaxID=1912939 RepID=A0AAD4HQJ6_9AGAM|nr:NUDIX hydrolase domain-like protein [Suillus fuscotomentosus]KAG1905338.1 NUDIX hydrolase domain-like protein [Suillus fuscotomentosus]
MLWLSPLTIPTLTSTQPNSEKRLGDIRTHVLKRLTSKSRACVERLRTCQLDRPDLSRQPTSKLAAVLVLLYEQAGELRVLLTTRSKSLRAHPGQTALPGGKADEGDESLVWTALREANEEVGLPLPPTSSNIHFITTLPPFLSASQLLVTPVVVLLSSPLPLVTSSPSFSTLDSSSNASSNTPPKSSSHPILTSLTPSLTEVDRIFDHPLEAMLDPRLLLNKGESLVDVGEDWPYSAGDVYNPSDVRLDAFDGLIYRMHRFRTCASPIKGLTADILITVAELAYGRKPVYGRYPSGPSSGSSSKDTNLEGETYQALVRRRMEENERAFAVAVEEGGQT